MNVDEVLNFNKINDVKFIRLAFCDIFGTLKNLSINEDELERAINEGIEFDASGVSGFMNVHESDLLLFPDLNTMSILPWRPSEGRVVRFFCDIKHPDGTPFEGDGRYFLSQAMEACESYGYTPNIGIESEFYLFRNDHDGNPTTNPLDHASYFDVAPLDSGEDIRREICLSLEEMNIKTKASYHEKGPGQNVVTFQDADALKAADNFITFKNCVKSIASFHDLYASFLPKPRSDISGNGLRIKILLNKNDRNIFEDEYAVDLEEQRSFIAGVLNRIYEINLFLNPIPNSYLRLGRDKAPKHISWASGNKSQLLRVDEKQNEFSYIMLRSPDASCNPYYVYGLLLYAGVEGMRNKESLQDKEQIYKNQELPNSLLESVEGMRNSNFIKSVMNERTIATILNEKEEEAKQHDTSCEFEDDEYFMLI